jgi:predicted ATP-binding protein involved in virulence
MAHVASFSVTGLAGRDEQYAVSLDNHVNIFFGSNGSGKTSLLKILHAALDNTTVGLLSVPFQKAEVKIHSINFDTTFTRTIDKTTVKEYQELVEAPPNLEMQRRRPEAGLARLAEIERTMSWSITPARDKLAFSHSYLPTTRLYSGFDPYDLSRTRDFDPRRVATAEEAFEAHFAVRLERIWQTYFSEILNAVRKIQADGLASILKLVLASESQHGSPRPEVDPGMAYQRVNAFLERQGSPGILGSQEEFRGRYSGTSTFREVVSDINNVEQQIDEVMQPKSKLQNLINKMITGRKTVSLESNAISVETLDHKFLSLASLSSGEKHVLRILIEPLIAGPNPIIIDEPELSMHVDWQRELVSAVMQLNPDCQLILATHSPEIMVGIDDSQIHSI